jgi:hypothetical protein
MKIIFHRISIALEYIPRLILLSLTFYIVVRLFVNNMLSINSESSMCLFILCSSIEILPVFCKNSILKDRKSVYYFKIPLIVILLCLSVYWNNLDVKLFINILDFIF